MRSSSLPWVLLLAVFCGTLVGWVGLSCTPPVTAAAEHFPIVGKHLELECADCHEESLRGAPTTCSGCHLGDEPPDHYEGECGDCHTEDGWELGVVDHERFLSLEGGHAALLCTDCHDEADITTLDAACISCHAEDEPPDHYGPACEDCHDVFGWEDAVFEHPYFPIPHQGVSECADCHPGGDTTGFSCTDCHAHEKNEMDDEHQGEVDDYVYDSDACLECHPNGQE